MADALLRRQNAVRIDALVDGGADIKTGQQQAVGIGEEGLQLNAGVIPPNTPGLNSTPLPVVESIFGSSLFGSEDHHMARYETASFGKVA